MPHVPEGYYAWTVKIGEKGQLVLPKEAREVFDLHPGDTILLLGDIRQGIAIPPKKLMQETMARVFGNSESKEE